MGRGRESSIDERKPWFWSSGWREEKSSQDEKLEKVQVGRPNREERKGESRRVWGKKE